MLYGMVTVSPYGPLMEFSAHAPLQVVVPASLLSPHLPDLLDGYKPFLDLKPEDEALRTPLGAMLYSRCLSSLQTLCEDTSVSGFDVGGQGRGRRGETRRREEGRGEGMGCEGNGGEGRSDWEESGEEVG